MGTTATIARIFLGLLIFAAGLSGGSLNSVELVAGVLVLANRFAPLALTLLAAVIASIISLT